MYLPSAFCDMLYSHLQAYMHRQDNSSNTRPKAEATCVLCGIIFSLGLKELSSTLRNWLINFVESQMRRLIPF